MNFREAIYTVFVKKYFTFSGRASRSEFWWSYLLFVIFNKIISYVIDKIPENSFLLNIIIFKFPLLVYIGFFLDIAIFIPLLSVGIRRMHDNNYTGLWYGTFVILNIIWINAVALSSIFNDTFKTYMTFFVKYYNYIIIVDLGICIYIFVILIKRGTDGSNRFGSDSIGLQTNEDIFK